MIDQHEKRFITSLFYAKCGLMPRAKREEAIALYRFSDGEARQLRTA